MTLESFIRKHRKEIDARIADHLKMHRAPRRNDAERRMYLSNVEPLYIWARAQGVDFDR